MKLSSRSRNQRRITICGLKTTKKQSEKKGFPMTENRDKASPESGFVRVRENTLWDIRWLLNEAADVIGRLPEDKWEKFGARDFLYDELWGAALILRDLLAAAKEKQ
jgi:hypothetical protein